MTLDPPRPVDRRSRRRVVRGVAVALAATLVVVSCGSDDDDAAPASTEAAEPTAADTAEPVTEAGDDGDDATAPTDDVDESATDPSESLETVEVPSEETAGGEVTFEGISEERCAANQSAGQITYLSGFDFAAASSILDVVVADANGYFEQMCLDVELVPSFSVANYPLIASGQGQFASAGNYTELLNFGREGAEYVAIINYGKTPIEGLVVPGTEVTDLSQLEGQTVGVKGDIPSSLVAMLRSAGLVRGESYDEVLLDGFDPIAHLQTDIDALPVYKSNEPSRLDAEGVQYTLFDPADLGIPGSFGIIYTSQSFYDEHPTAVEDFARASLRGMQFAIEDPAAAVDVAVGAIDAAGNQNFLTQEGELFRWQQDLREVLRGAGGDPVGVINPELFSAEYAAYVEAGVWPPGQEPADTMPFDAELARSLYTEDGTLIWPME